jgi:hypothetical protein
LGFTQAKQYLGLLEHLSIFFVILPIDLVKLFKIFLCC